MIIIDSNITLEEALTGAAVPDDIRETLVLLDINHISFDGTLRRGQLVAHREVADELSKIFAELLTLRFPIQKIIPVSFYEWSDDASMADNNTSAFNYRVIYGTTRLSNHSYGLALDINPVLNPYHAADGKIFPPNTQYRQEIPGTLKADGEVVALFMRYGWEWGGTWEHKDWQHFQKIL